MLSLRVQYRLLIAILMAVVVVYAGLIGFAALPLYYYAPEQPQAVSLELRYAGAEAEELKREVAAPIEKELLKLDDVVYSCSAYGDNGLYKFTLIFRPGADVRQATEKCFSIHRQAKAELSSGCEQITSMFYHGSSEILCAVSFRCRNDNRRHNVFSDSEKERIRSLIERASGDIHVEILPQTDFTMLVYRKPGNDDFTDMAAIEESLDELQRDLPPSVRWQFDYRPESNFLVRLKLFLTPLNITPLVVALIALPILLFLRRKSL